MAVNVADNPNTNPNTNPNSNPNPNPNPNPFCFRIDPNVFKAVFEATEVTTPLASRIPGRCMYHARWSVARVHGAPLVPPLAREKPKHADACTRHASTTVALAMLTSAQREERDERRDERCQSVCVQEKGTGEGGTGRERGPRSWR